MEQSRYAVPLEQLETRAASAELVVEVPTSSPPPCEPAGLAAAGGDGDGD